MRIRATVLIALVLVVGACGGRHGAARTAPPRHAPVPDVRGADVKDAVGRLTRARYCVRLRVGTSIGSGRSMPVQRESPPAGSAAPAWSTVTLTVGVPRPPGAPKHGRVSVGVDVSGSGVSTPCPPIETVGATG